MGERPLARSLAAGVVVEAAKLRVSDFGGPMATSPKEEGLQRQRDVRRRWPGPETSGGPWPSAGVRKRSQRVCVRRWLVGGAVRRQDPPLGAEAETEGRRRKKTAAAMG